MTIARMFSDSFAGISPSSVPPFLIAQLVGGAIAYAALLAVIAAIILLLDNVMPSWGASLLVGVVVAGIGWLLIGKAVSALQQTDVTPRETVETLKEDAAWMKQQIK